MTLLAVSVHFLTVMHKRALIIIDRVERLVLGISVLWVFIPTTLLSLLFLVTFLGRSDKTANTLIMFTLLISSIAMISFSYMIVIKKQSILSINPAVHLFVGLGVLAAIFLAAKLDPIFAIPLAIVAYVYWYSWRIRG